MKKSVIQTPVLGLFLVAACAAGIIWWGYRSLKQVPEFYEVALGQSDEELQQASHELETQAGAFFSDTQSEGNWSAVFTEEQINGWLQVKLMGDHAGLVSAKVRDPRLVIRSGAVKLGLTTIETGVETVVTVDAALFLTEGGLVGVRLQGVRAGTLRLPSSSVAENLRNYSDQWPVPVSWTLVEGDPVALVDLAQAVIDDDQVLQIETIELNEGEIFIAGRTAAQNAPHESVSTLLAPEESLLPDRPQQAADRL